MRDKSRAAVAPALLLTVSIGVSTLLASAPAAQELDWVAQAGGPDHETGASVAVDGAGNAIVTGYFRGTATFGEGGTNETTLTAAGDEGDTFAAKYGPDGALLWVTRAGGSGGDVNYETGAEGTAVDVDGAGNAVIAGSFWGPATFGEGADAVTLSEAGGGSVFVAKYGPDGALLWATQAGGDNSARGHGVAVDDAGNAVITGSFWGPATFGEGEANETTLTGAGDYDIFVAKYDPDGALLWATQAGGAPSAPYFYGTDEGYGVAVDGAGNAVVTGRFGGTATFGEGEANETTLTGAGGDDIFIAKYDPDGALLWATQAGGASSGIDEGQGVAVDGAGNAIVTGYFRGTATFGEGADAIILTATGFYDLFVAKYDPDGALLWVTQADGNDLGSGADVAVDGAGNAVVIGRFEGTETFGEGADAITLTAAGSSIFVAKYDPDGALLWATQAGSRLGCTIGGTARCGVAADAAGNIVVTGAFGGTVTFGEGETNETTLTAAGGVDVFVARWLVEPEEKLAVLIAAIRALVAAGDPDAGLAVRLNAILDRALDSLAHDRLNTACGQLGAFANQGEALVRSRRLAGEDAAVLLTGADEVHYQLGC